jgi:GNAT superfamily N-acetyltransferase
MAHPPLRADGKITSVVTSLEMTEPPASPPLAPPRGDVTVVLAARPTVSFYRYLYDTTGEPWLWGDRRRLDDAALAAIVHDPAVEVFVAYLAGVPAGYVELDGRVPGDVEIAYLGVLPDFIGQKLGPYLLSFALHTAWSRRPGRVWVHTCTLDHPAALAMYQRAGLRVFKTETETGDDPRALGLIRG